MYHRKAARYVYMLLAWFRAYKLTCTSDPQGSYRSPLAAKACTCYWYVDPLGQDPGVVSKNLS